MNRDKGKGRRIIRGAPRIIIPRYKFAEIPVHVRLGLQGWFELESIGPHYGIVRRRAAWAQHITDQGLDIICGATLGGTAWGRVEVGTGNNPITDGTTSLTNGIAVSSTQLSETFTLNPAPPPYYCTASRVFQFAQGTFNNDNLAEVAIGSGTGLNPINVMCGDLIRDSGGNPTTFPVSSEEILRVTHRMRVYIPGAEADIDGGSVAITGSGNHDVTIRACNADIANAWALRGFLAINTASGGGDHAQVYGTQTLGSINDNGPSTAEGVETRESATSLDYSQGTFFRDWELRWGLEDANDFTIGSIAWGISGLNAPFSDFRQFQASFNPKIDKFAGGVQRILTIQGRTYASRVSGS